MNDGVNASQTLTCRTASAFTVPSKGRNRGRQFQPSFHPARLSVAQDPDAFLSEIPDGSCSGRHDVPLQFADAGHGRKRDLSIVGQRKRRGSAA